MANKTIDQLTGLQGANVDRAEDKLLIWDDSAAAGERTKSITLPQLEVALTGKATSAQGALANTALQPAAIGVTVQPFDSDLAAISNLSGDGYLQRQSGVWNMGTGGVGATALDQRELLSSTQTTWTLAAIPELPHLTQFFVNGQKQLFGVDYTINGAIVTWLGYALRPAWRVEIYY